MILYMIGRPLYDSGRSSDRQKQLSNGYVYYSSNFLKSDERLERSCIRQGKIRIISSHNARDAQLGPINRRGRKSVSRG